MFELLPNPPEDLTRYNLIAQVANLLAEGDEDEWAFFFNSLRNGCTEHKTDHVNLFLKIRDDLKARLDGPVTPEEFFGIPSPLGDLPPTDKSDIPPSFLAAFDGDDDV